MSSYSVSPPPHYLSVCAIFCDEAAYLHEWIEFHRLVGVERFFLYDHKSTDDWRTVLEPYVERGEVVVHDWPVDPGQVEAYQDCIERHGHESRWIAFIDLDEFLFCPTGEPVPEILRDYEDFPGVGVNWRIFGTSGHVTKPDGLVTESYMHFNRNPHSRRTIKSIVDPSRVQKAVSGHYFEYRDGLAVDELERPITGPDFAFTETMAMERLRINHYAQKSMEESRRKRARVRADTGDTKRDPGEPKFGDVWDDAIQRYLPRLREALTGPD
jgi:Glycosyltransferase family 92